jgi:hypothetical protein
MLPLWGMGWAGGASSPPWGRYSFNMRNFEKQTQRPLTKPGISNVPYNTGHIKQKQKTTQLRNAMLPNLEAHAAVWTRSSPDLQSHNST